MIARVLGLAILLATNSALAQLSPPSGGGATCMGCTVGTIPVVTGAGTMGNSPITVSGSNIGIGTTPAVASNLSIGPAAGTYSGIQLNADNQFWAVDNRGNVDTPNDRLTFIYNGSQDLFTIQSNGNVDIGGGTVLLPQRLVLYEGSVTAKASLGLAFYSDGTLYGRVYSYGGNLVLANSTSDVLTLNGTGTVGIASTANKTSLNLAGISETGSDASGALNLSGTWNTSGSPNAILVNMTNTASGANAALIDLAVSSTPLFTVSPSGIVTMGGGIGTTASYLQIQNTLTSPSTGIQFGVSNQVSFNPSGASVSTINGDYVVPTLSGSSLAVPSFYGVSSHLQETSGYTGTVTNGFNFYSDTPVTSGANPIAAFVGFAQAAITNGTGNTSGTIANEGVKIAAITAVAGSGGTMNNTGVQIVMPSGTNVGTETARGLFITGNGITGGTAVNYAIDDESTALAYFNGPTTINNATFKVTTLAAATALDVVCYTTATGLFTEEPTATTCTVSDERKKTAMRPISLQHSLDTILASTPISYYYKKSAMLDDKVHLGFGAQTLAKIDPELVERDEDGVPNAVKQIELLPVTWAAIKQLNIDINRLRAEVENRR
jgi:hypothetical protein